MIANEDFEIMKISKNLRTLGATSYFDLQQLLIIPWFLFQTSYFLTKLHNHKKNHRFPCEDLVQYQSCLEWLDKTVNHNQEFLSIFVVVKSSRSLSPSNNKLFLSRNRIWLNMYNISLIFYPQFLHSFRCRKQGKS